MKQILYITLFSLILFSCSLKEDPVFYSGDTLFNNSEGANAVLNGVYSSADNSYSNGFPQMIMGSSGLLGINTLPFSTTIGSLLPNSSLTLLEEYWNRSFKTIACSNDLIIGLSGSEFPDEEEKNNILGQAYFIRAWKYFNVVRIWGGVPLITERSSLDNINQPRASIDEVYQQIISDAEKAVELLPDIASQNVGYPGKQAVNMLLAKIYMTLAGNQSSSETDYWQKAWDEVVEVYGKYQLVSDFKSLWYEETGDNTPESIFEIQGNESYGAASRWERIFSSANSNAGRNMYGRMWANLEVYDSHVQRYPDDPRIAATFVTSYTQYNSNGTTTTMTTYPTYSGRGNANRSYPRLFKYFIKDPTKSNYNNNKNLIIFRYSDLLLMMAEIENELNGPDNAYQYVNEVLQRARNSSETTAVEPADWSGLSREEFREAIMKEYDYELLGEGQEWFTTRRRGYAYFKSNIIDVHNSHSNYNFTKNYDNEYPDNERIMLLPIPSSEISANSSINTSDQNSGY